MGGPRAGRISDAAAAVAAYKFGFDVAVELQSKQNTSEPHRRLQNRHKKIFRFFGCLLEKL